MRPHDLQSEVIQEIARMVEHPDLDAEELGKIAITLEAFQASELVTSDEAAGLLAPRIWGPSW